MSKVRTRFAPSPTGRMHVGNLRTALYEYLIAKHEGGDFILRIEDTDQERFVEGAIDIIYRTLEKTGLVHDEGPDKGGNYGPYRQSERKAIYLKYATELIEMGEAYYCFCEKDNDENCHCRDLEEHEVEKLVKEKTTEMQELQRKMNIQKEKITSESKNQILSEIRQVETDVQTKNYQIQKLKANLAEIMAQIEQENSSYLSRKLAILSN